MLLLYDEQMHRLNIKHQTLRLLPQMIERKRKRKTNDRNKEKNFFECKLLKPMQLLQFTKLNDRNELSSSFAITLIHTYFFRFFLRIFVNIIINVGLQTF